MDASDVSMHRLHLTKPNEDTYSEIYEVHQKQTGGTEHAYQCLDRRTEQGTEADDIKTEILPFEKHTLTSDRLPVKPIVYVLIAMNIVTLILSISAIVIVKFTSAKVHGGWSAWEAWSTCSNTCDLGIQRRQRTCTNPAPQGVGEFCFGLNFDDRMCMSAVCSNGGWSAWGPWGTCSVTCGEGFWSRSRTCTNPIPSFIGKYCEGDPLQVGACNNSVCKGHHVAFRSKDVINSSPTSGQLFVFKTTTLNEGLWYDRSTGIFTAPVAGTYLFSIQLCLNDGQDVDYAIVVDNVNVKVGHFSDATWDLCYTADTVAVLRSGSRVWVKCVSGTCPLYIGTYFWNTFSGALVYT